VAERGRLVDDAQPGQLLGPRRDPRDHLDHVVHVALRVRAPRDREPHEVHRRRHLAAVGAPPEHHRADLAAAHAALEVQRDRERLPRVRERRDVRQQRPRVEVHRVAAGRAHDRHAEPRQRLARYCGQRIR
jgi:hypothetical protein